MLIELEMALERWRYRYYYPGPELQEIRSLIEYLNLSGSDIHYPLPEGDDRRLEVASLRRFACQLVEACDEYTASLNTPDARKDGD